MPKALGLVCPTTLPNVGYTTLVYLSSLIPSRIPPPGSSEVDDPWVALQSDPVPEKV